jgi:hypothetical protein
MALGICGGVSRGGATKTWFRGNVFAVVRAAVTGRAAEASNLLAELRLAQVIEAEAGAAFKV